MTMFGTGQSKGRSLEPRAVSWLIVYGHKDSVSSQHSHLGNALLDLFAEK
jgi:hypothetical protein